MTLPASSQRPDSPLRVGIPWRTTAEERAGQRQKLDYYFACVRQAGAAPVAISLQQSGSELAAQLQELDAFVLPGSPSDVDPARYGAIKNPLTAAADAKRDATDAAILVHAIENLKPVLAICYGCQALNVFQGGTLVQDVPTEKPGSLTHGKTDLAASANIGDLYHSATLTPGSRLAHLNGSTTAEINTSHHQAIDRPGRNLRVTAEAPDGIVEAVEFTADAPWLVGVQWHPERMANDAFSARLFADFAAAARNARGALTPSR
jgi:putative glutamine amidotransferase